MFVVHCPQTLAHLVRMDMEKATKDGLLSHHELEWLPPNSALQFHVTLLTNSALLSGSSFEVRNNIHQLPLSSNAPFANRLKLNWPDYIRVTIRGGARPEEPLHNTSTLFPLKHIFSKSRYPLCSSLHCLKKKDNHTMTAATWLFDRPLCPTPPKYLSLSQRFTQVVNFSRDQVVPPNSETAQNASFFFTPLAPQISIFFTHLLISLSDFSFSF